MKIYNPTIIGNTVSDGSFTGTEFLGINADTITTAVSITNATLTDAGYSQSGKVIKIDNGANAINYTVNARLTASFVKGGTGAITFVQGAGRTLIGVYGLVFDGAVGSTASISSFGTTDIVTISGNILNGEIRLPAYPNTRNDGVIPTNKVLSTDANGNLKLYSVAFAPAPFLDYVVPDSTLPSTTGNFQLHGSFFTPSMCLPANLATSIIFTGQTVNYAIFHSDNWIEVNITTGATEGIFAITLNNGLSATFPNAILIIWGTVYKPLTADWSSVDKLTINNDQVNLNIYNVESKATWNQEFNYLVNFRIQFKTRVTPLGNVDNHWDTRGRGVIFSKVSDGGELINLLRVGTSYNKFMDNTPFSVTGSGTNNINGLCEIRWESSVLYYYLNGVLRGTSPMVFTENIKLSLKLYTWEIYDLKYIELD